MAVSGIDDDREGLLAHRIRSIDVVGVGRLREREGKRERQAESRAKLSHVGGDYTACGGLRS